MEFIPGEQDVLDANREYYDQLDISQYESDPAIFAPGRQGQIHSMLQSLKPRSASGRLLDAGCGTGNILRLAEGIYDKRFGIDLSGMLLEKLNERNPELLLCQSEIGSLPFQDESFDLCTCYSVLHHLYSHETTFREIYRVLRHGGFLYTDHDPDYFFYRFYYPIYRYRLRAGQKGSAGQIAEYHHTYTNGLNPDKFAGLLYSIGFERVDVHYRMTENLALGRLYRFAISLMRWGSRIYPFRSLYTHFQIVARK